MRTSLTYGVGPQNIENEKTCKTAKAIKTSPGTILMRICLAQFENDPPPCLFRLVSRSLAVPAGARVKWPTKPAWVMSILSPTRES